MAVEKPRSSDASAVALLKWIMAGLLLVNGAALIVSTRGRGGHGSLFGGSRWNYAAGLVCALAGALCWAVSHGSIPRHEAEEEWHAAPPEQPGSRDRAIGFGALAIMFWVASLTTFVAGCEHLSWTPATDTKLIHPAGRADRQ